MRALDLPHNRAPPPHELPNTRLDGARIARAQRHSPANASARARRTIPSGIHPQTRALTTRTNTQVLDCGGQYCHLIASRVRRHEALSVIVPCDAPVSTFADAGAIIVSGGPQSVFDPASMRVDKALWDLPVPILGICYGCQMMCQDLGGKVEQAAVGEYGPATLEVVKAGGVMPGDADQTTVWMSHRDKVVALPPGFETTGKTAACANAAVQCCDGSRRLYGLQLHPEVTHSAKGEAMLGAFVELSGLKGTWKMDDFVDQQIAAIRAKCGASRNVFVLVSGGVDSTVTYALLAKALPAERILGLYVDTGMMRKGESELVSESLAGADLPNLKAVDASAQFLKALEGLTAPEAKRRVIGQQFLEIQRAQAKAYGLDPAKWLLGQGTIYPDTIESGGSAKKADVIKTHHNRVPEIDALIEQGLVIEPLADLYKDEVRAVGERLGLASHLVWRQPFPGPGLGVRLLCHDGAPEPVDDAAARARAAATISAALPAGVAASVPPLRSVGCQGDSRTYRNFAILAGAYERDWDALGAISTELVNESKLVNRVVVSLLHASARDAPLDFAVSPGGPHTVTTPRLDVLREADAIVTDMLTEDGVMRSIWQCPVAMAPLGLAGQAGEEVIILRPVDSTEAMTAAFSKVPFALCDKIAAAIKAKLPQVADVLYDVTNKPPGTIEWE